MYEAINADLQHLICYFLSCLDTSCGRRLRWLSSAGNLYKLYIWRECCIYYARLSSLNVDKSDAMSIYEKARQHKPKRKMKFVNWKKVWIYSSTYLSDIFKVPHLTAEVITLSTAGKGRSSRGYSLEQTRQLSGESTGWFQHRWAGEIF